MFDQLQIKINNRVEPKEITLRAGSTSLNEDGKIS